MYGLKELLGQEESRLKQIKKQVDKRLTNVPEGNLRITSSGKKIQFMYCSESDEDNKKRRQGTFIKKENRDLARKLAQKSYDQRVQKLVERRLKQVQKLNSEYEDDEIVKIYQQMHALRQELVRPVEKLWEQRVSEWKSVPYKGKEFAPGWPEIYTKKGERVRSKSEKILADMFYDLGIEYKYECPLKLKGVGIVYPDFTFLSKKTFEEIYWEHDGRMNDPEYAEKAVRKIDAYTRNGIFPGKRLLVTYETSNYVLSTSVVKALIQEHLL
ncbi:MAG: hypothetical protein K6G10_13195 [Butyrivibrio sp.]|nr:hypothetical protein [Butyrivibrio sp.]